MSLKTKLLLILVFLSFIPTLSLAGPSNGWIYQNPYPTSNTLLAVKFVTQKKGWIAGEKGTILYTGDGGDSWEYQESGTEQDLKSLAFVNEKIGWAVGNGGVIIHTEDGGTNWIKQGDITAALHIVSFVNEKEGWIGGVEGMLLHTTDGGKNWNKEDIKAWADIAGIFFRDANTGWVLSGGRVFRTTDGGKNWDSSELPPISLPGRGFDRPVFHGWEGSVFFLNENKGFASVGLPYIFYTYDGGKTWLADRVQNTVDRIVFTDEKNGCMAGTSILCTEDGGKTWKERLGVRPGEQVGAEGSIVALWGLSFADKSIGWAVGKDGQIWKTGDGGKNWKVKSRGYSSAYFLDFKIGWDLQYDKLDSASIVKTEDSGKSWKNQKVFDAERVNIRFFFINAETGWATGEEWEQTNSGPIIHNYFILHTKDGGKTWDTQFKGPGGEMGVSNDFQDAFFINSNIGWAVGTNGLILHTKDGGKHWKRQKSGTKSELWKVQFVDAKRGWIIGNKVTEGSGTSIILHTEDGGEHWHPQWKKETEWMWLSELRFIDEKNGWAIGNITEYSGDSIFLHTANSGKTWSEKVFEGAYFDKMFFLDKDRGVILTDKGQMHITRDGGKTWDKQRVPIRPYPWHVSEIFKVQ